nr:MAG TPA: hypothetical protein [Caudoviricetes sp.]
MLCTISSTFTIFSSSSVPFSINSSEKSSMSYCAFINTTPLNFILFLF